MRKLFYSLTILLTSLIAFNGCSNSSDGNQKAKFIFLFIGDGMGHEQVCMAEAYLSYKAGKMGGERLSFAEFPYLAMAETYSANRNITCSAAGGSAIACGMNTKNGWLGLDAEGNPVQSIASILHDEGYKVGIMTTVPFNHATPASFYAHNNNRDDYYNITMDIPKSGFEFFAGAGLYDRTGKDGSLPPVEDCLTEAGYTVTYGLSEFNEKVEDSEKVIFMQNSAKKEKLDYYDANGKEKGDISLKEMLGLCLDFLGDEDPFFIMCEGGEIDWAAHSNQVMPMIEEIMGFDEAIQTAIEFYKKHPEETLIIVTADHETGGPTIGVGMDWKKEIVGWELIEKNWAESGNRNNLSYEENKAMNTQALIGWTSSHHTGGHVPVYAIGKGAERFCGRIDNTDIMRKILGE